MVGAFWVLKTMVILVNYKQILLVERNQLEAFLRNEF